MWGHTLFMAASGQFFLASSNSQLRIEICKVLEIDARGCRVLGFGWLGTLGLRNDFDLGGREGWQSKIQSSHSHMRTIVHDSRHTERHE
jgi:hypothetical protein